MEITAKLVNELREKTGVGMMQCKKALVEAAGDMEKAMELLRKQGAAVAAKRADKEAKQGTVLLRTVGGLSVAVEINCETDFVAGSDDFKKLGEDVLTALTASQISDLEALKSAKAGSATIADRLSEIVGKIGENIGVRRFAYVSVGAGETVALYSHMGGKIGVIAKLAYQGTPSDASALEAIAKDVAMQVAAFAPLAVDESGVPAEYIAKEREIYKEQIINEGKTKPEFVDRQVDGRVKKYLQEVSLLNQIFVKDQKSTVRDMLKAEGAKLGLSNLTAVQFVRFELGK